MLVPVQEVVDREKVMASRRRTRDEPDTEKSHGCRLDPEIATEVDRRGVDIGTKVDAHAGNAVHLAREINPEEVDPVDLPGEVDADERNAIQLTAEMLIGPMHITAEMRVFPMQTHDALLYSPSSHPATGEKALIELFGCRTA